MASGRKTNFWKVGKMDTKAPDHLSPRAKELWGQLVPRRCGSPEQKVLLQAALEALDRSDQAGRILAAEGLTIKTLGSGTVHAHPCIQIEKESRAAFVKTWNLLNLQWTPGHCAVRSPDGK
jgi:phage terminase small subunit